MLSQGKTSEKERGRTGPLRTLTRNWGFGALATEVLEAALSRKPRGEPRRSLEGSRSCAICFIACHPHTGVCVRLKSRWPYHRAGGAPPMAEAMDGKEEVRVVEEQPAWQAGSLESLDVIDKVPDESVKLAAD